MSSKVHIRSPHAGVLRPCHSFTLQLELPIESGVGRLHAVVAVGAAEPLRTVES